MIRAAVAVPAHNEVELIGPCLSALAREAPAAIVLLVNNSTDGTAAAARALGLPGLEVIEHDFPDELACAGAARRMALERAAARAGADGAVLTTDADGAVRPGWLTANLRCLAAGAEAVAGRAVLDAAGHASIPRALHEADAAEVAYARALDALGCALDPLPWDPWPRHAEESGASIASTVAAWRRAGGMPALPHAEDRGFFAALRRVDACVRHAPEVEVVVSARTEGRAAGGMADTIKRRLRAPDPFLDDALEPADTAALRAELRACFRRAHRAGVAPPGLARRLLVGPPSLDDALAAPFAGEGWAALEAASPALRRTLVRTADVPAQTARAHALLAGLSVSA